MKNFWKKLSLVTAIILGAVTILSCPSPVINVKTVNAPEIVDLESGYYTTEQTLTVKTGYGGLAEYSLDGGDTWIDYNGPVTLEPTSRQLYNIVARQYDNEGSVSGNTPEFSVYMDAAPFSAFSTENLSSGVFLKAKSVFVLRRPNAKIDYSLDGGASWQDLPKASFVISLSTDGDYTVLIVQKDQQGNILSETDPATISIMSNAEPTFSAIPGTYESDQTVSVTIPHPSLDLQFKKLDGTWTYWEGESLSVNNVGVYLGDWTNGAPVQLTNNGEALVARLRDAEGNLSPEYEYIYEITSGDLSAPTLSGISAGYHNSNQMLGVTFDGDRAEYSLDGGATWNTYSGFVNITTEGQYQVVARHYDQFNRLAGVSETITFTLDKTAPATPTLTGNSGSFAAAQIYTLSNIETESTGYLSVDGGSSWTTYTAPVELTNGSYVVVGRTVDQAGNISMTTSSISVTIVGTPTATITGISEGYFATQQSFTISQNPNFTEQYSLDDGATWINYTGGSVFLNAEQEYKVKARYLDSLSSVVSETDTITLTVDLTAPASLVPSLASGNYIVSQVVTLSNIEVGANVEYRYDVHGPEWLEYSGGNINLTVSPGSGGNYVFEFKQTDAAGNVSDVVTRNYKLEGRTPVLWPTPPADGKYNEGFTVTAYEYAGFTSEVSIDGGSTWETTTSIDLFDQPMDGSGIISETNQIYVRIKDDVGNTRASDLQATYEFQKIDNEIRYGGINYQDMVFWKVKYITAGPADLYKYLNKNWEQDPFSAAGYVESRMLLVYESRMDFTDEFYGGSKILNPSQASTYAAFDGDWDSTEVEIVNNATQEVYFTSTNGYFDLSRGDLPTNTPLEFNTIHRNEYGDEFKIHTFIVILPMESLSTPGLTLDGFNTTFFSEITLESIGVPSWMITSNLYNYGFNNTLWAVNRGGQTGSPGTNPYTSYPNSVVIYLYDSSYVRDNTKIGYSNESFSIHHTGKYILGFQNMGYMNVGGYYKVPILVDSVTQEAMGGGVNPSIASFDTLHYFR